MIGRVDRLPSSLRDLDEIAEFLRRQGGPDRAIRFLRAAEATFRRLASMPGIGGRYEPELPIPFDVRFSPIDRFRSYLAFYRPTADGIVVLRVLHGARDLDAILDPTLRPEAGAGLDDEGA